MLIGRENHIHKFSKDLAPCARVSPGARLAFETFDALEGRGAQPYDPFEPEASRLSRANPATGPVFIDGARRGDALEVEIHDILPEGPGYITLFKPYAPDPPYISFSFADGVLTRGGARYPARPMIGVIGCAPDREMWTQEAGDHGGNIDTSLIGKGAKVLLPVFADGALFALGDVHAAMGDGELFGQGVEIGATVEATVRVRRDIKIARPVIVTRDRIACVASGGSIDDIAYTALTDLGRILTDLYGLKPEEAGLMIALYANLRVCQIVNPQKTVRLELLKSRIGKPRGHAAL